MLTTINNEKFKNEKEFIKYLNNEIKKGNKTIINSILNILEINSKITEKQKCEKKDADKLRNNLISIGLNFNINKTLKEDIENIIASTKFIFKNIDKIWESNNHSHH